MFNWVTSSAHAVSSTSGRATISSSSARTRPENFGWRALHVDAMASSAIESWVSRCAIAAAWLLFFLVIKVVSEYP
jgi:hypothetical protein